MRLSSELVNRFQQRYFDVFSEHISYEDAEIELLELAALIKNTSHKEPVDKEFIKTGGKDE